MRVEFEQYIYIYKTVNLYLLQRNRGGYGAGQPRTCNKVERCAA